MPPLSRAGRGRRALFPAVLRRRCLQAPIDIVGPGMKLFDLPDSNGRYYLEVFPSEQYMTQSLHTPGSKKTEHLSVSTFAAIHGVYATSPEALLDANQYAETLDRVYGTVMAQFLGGNGTRPATDVTVTTEYLFLVQSPISARIMEGVLAAMVICALVTISFMNTRSVLPKNPASITGMASLLAVSELAMQKVVPVGPECCDDQALDRRGVFKNWTFSLAWWPSWRASGGDYSGVRYGVDLDS